MSWELPLPAAWSQTILYSCSSAPCLGHCLPLLHTPRGSQGQNHSPLQVSSAVSLGKPCQTHIPLGSPSTHPSTAGVCQCLHTQVLGQCLWVHSSLLQASRAQEPLSTRNCSFPWQPPSAHALQVGETTLLPSHLATLLSLFQLL